MAIKARTKSQSVAQAPVGRLIHAADLFSTASLWLHSPDDGSPYTPRNPIAST
jgi:hypothetical protein